MSDLSGMFSESWHRVAGQRLALHPGVRVIRQTDRGQRHYVLENPFSNDYFRLRPPAWEFVSRLRADRTVEEVWRECLEQFPDEAPGQEAVVQLLGQLYHANLLRYDHAADTRVLSERRQQRQQRELRARLANIMFFRIPLVDPDRFLVRTLPWVGWVWSPLGALMWLVVVGLGLKAVADHWTAAVQSAEGILGPSNLPWLYGALVVLKTLHELGHAYACRRFGGEVHTLGLMFMIFTPVPYVDVTSSWGFRSAAQRALVGAAGMVVELFVAAVAAMVWAGTGAGIVHSVAYNVMLTAGVSTLIFNLNPLLRFDGYYILTDLLRMPNLAMKSNQHLRYLAERYLFGVKRGEGSARTSGERWVYPVFGSLSGVYRILVFAGVLLAVADQYLLLGLVMLAVCLVSWIAVPVIRLLSYLASNPRLDRVRPRAIGVSLGIAVILVVGLGIVPWPARFRAPGVVQTVERTQVMTEAAGEVVRLVATPGGRVEAGQALMELRNRDLEFELRSVEAALAELDARIQQSLSDEIANVRPLEARREALRARRVRVMAEIKALTVVAVQSGIWAASDALEYVGRWLPRGSPVGLILNGESRGSEFVATVLQSDADRLFRQSGVKAEVRLRGQAGVGMATPRFRVLPAEHVLLPSAALGWAGGGEVPVERNDQSGRRSSEPFFEVRAELGDGVGVGAGVWHGRTGKIRFELAPEPLAQQGWRRLRQLVQKRYQI